MYLDLHIHSYFSDGEASLENITNEAIKKRCKLFTITDHNFLSNSKMAKEIATKNDIRYIDGIEISTLCRMPDFKLSLHILGYGRKLNLNILNKSLQKTIDGYNRRAIIIINKLNKIFPDIALNLQSIQSGSHEMYVSRNTLARLVVEHFKNTISIKDALKQYVFIDEENDSWMMSPKESFKLIANAGGIPILAHSGRELRKLGLIEYEKMIKNLVIQGLLGVEVYFPKHTNEEINVLRSIARKFELHITGGSDWHGETYTPEVEIGLDIPTRDISSFLSDKRITVL